MDDDICRQTVTDVAMNYGERAVNSEDSKILSPSGRNIQGYCLSSLLCLRRQGGFHFHFFSFHISNRAGTAKAGRTLLLLVTFPW